MSNKKITIEEAINTIKQAMIDDGPSELGSYAHSWHCNISMACYDAICSNITKISHVEAHAIGNDAASRAMKILFDVETKN